MKRLAEGDGSLPLARGTKKSNKKKKLRCKPDASSSELRHEMISFVTVGRKKKNGTNHPNYDIQSPPSSENRDVFSTLMRKKLN